MTKFCNDKITFFGFCLMLLGNGLEKPYHMDKEEPHLFLSISPSHCLFRFLLHIHRSPAETPDFTFSGD